MRTYIHKKFWYKNSLCVLECGKGSHLSLLEPMCQRENSFPPIARCFPSRENLPTSPLLSVQQYPSRWHNWTFPVIRRLPGNVAKTPGVAQFAATCVFSLFLKVKSDNFPTRQSYKSIIQEAPCELEHTHIHTPAKHTETHTERHTHAERHSWRIDHCCSSEATTSLVFFSTRLQQTSRWRRNWRRRRRRQRIIISAV
jgi:hypothetical protein